MLAPHWTEKAANSFLIRPLDHEALVEVVVTTLYILRTEQFLNARSVEAWRFLRMLAASHAQVWNASQIGMSLGLDGKTVNSYLDHLVGAYLIRRLSPYQANTRKRLVKRPKVFWRDTGLLHALLNVSDEDTLLGQPWVGHSWEGFVIEQIIGELFSRGAQFEAYWMRTSDHHELDLVLDWGAERWALEIKLTTPTRADIDRLDKTADLIEAERRFLVSKTIEVAGDDQRASCDLPWLLSRLPD